MSPSRLEQAIKERIGSHDPVESTTKQKEIRPNSTIRCVQNRRRMRNSLPSNLPAGAIFLSTSRGQLVIIGRLPVVSLP